MRSSYKILLLLPLLSILCKKPDLPTPTASDILSVNVVENNVPADNYSYALITAAVDNAIVDTTNTVTFTTDLGQFSTGGTTYTTTFDLQGVQGVASAYLKATSPQTAHIKVTVGVNYSQSVTVLFTPSWPDTLYINTVASATNALSTRVDIMVQLYKAEGLITPGLLVNMSATDSAGKTIGSFTNIKPSDTSGGATGQFWLQDTTYTGFVNIQAKLSETNNKVLQTVNKILYVKQ